MLKRIREEKTFRSSMKNDIQEALQIMSSSEVINDKTELEEVWIDELIQRKKSELIRDIPKKEQTSMK
jgi:hypothetical protein